MVFAIHALAFATDASTAAAEEIAAIGMRPTTATSAPALRVEALSKAVDALTAVVRRSLPKEDELGRVVGAFYACDFDTTNGQPIDQGFLGLFPPVLGSGWANNLVDCLHSLSCPCL